MCSWLMQDFAGLYALSEKSQGILLLNRKIYEKLFMQASTDLGAWVGTEHAQH